jgi:tetratricopeptide (TPR) repeat protein
MSNWLAPNPAAAQVSVDTLIGNAVSDANDAQYQDIGVAISHFSKGDVAAAQALLESVRKKFPKLPPVEILMAKLFVAAKQLPAARAELEKAVRNHPGDPEAYVVFGDSTISDQRFAEAELAYLKAKSLTDAYNENPKRKRDFGIRSNAGLATIAEARGRWKDALPYLQAWHELDPDNAIIQQRLGRALFQTGKTNEAYKAFQEAAKLDAKADNANVLMAQLYEGTGDRPNAVKFIDFAAKQNPQDLKVQLAAANWAIAAGLTKEAEVFADAAMKIDPNSAEAKTARAQAHRIAGDLQKAQALLEKAHLEAPANLDIINTLALTLADQEDPKLIRRGLELADVNRRATTEGNQFSPAATVTYAWLLFRSGQGSQSDQMINSLGNSVNGLNPESQYYLSKILNERGRREVAIQLLENAVKTTAAFPQRKAAEELLASLKQQRTGG